ncbi:MAG: 16S rRNA (cytidine(1402)-2'-O)-methyltransferase [Verrucomicrobia bacterium]|nr:16S rRNA (cytidine(1402)-2'-O)-methyltransferase [Verrucomicrobiota bacterium]
MLFVVSTPIGNLGDITFRAVATLRDVDLVAAEDTRHAHVLLHHYQIEKPLVSYHEHNEARRTPELTSRLTEGTKVALLTDAGMPSISDPGYRLVSACRQQGIPVTVLPGPSAVLTALVGSGLATDSFHFGGFLPVKSGQRRSELERAAGRDVTSIYFESPHRLIRSLEVLAEVASDRRVCVARELTKRFEEFMIDAPGDLLGHYRAHPPRGEITLVIAPPPRRKASPSGPELGS